MADPQRAVALSVLASLREDIRMLVEQARACAVEVERLQGDADRLAEALRNLSDAVDTITHSPDYEVAEALYVGELGDAEDALLLHDNSTRTPHHSPNVEHDDQRGE